MKQNRDKKCEKTQKTENRAKNPNCSEFINGNKNPIESENAN